MKKLWLLAVLTVFALSAHPVSAAKSPAKNTANKTVQSSTGLVHTEKYGVGFQSTWPAWGLSGQMDINDKISGQLTFGSVDDTNVYSLRGLYNLKKSSEPFAHNYYGFAAVGSETYSTVDLYGDTSRESTFIFGFGAGVEGAPFKNAPVWLSFEMSVSFASFDNYSGSYGPGLNMGIGAHYRF